MREKGSCDGFSQHGENPRSDGAAAAASARVAAPDTRRAVLGSGVTVKTRQTNVGVVRPGVRRGCLFDRVFFDSVGALSAPPPATQREKNSRFSRSCPKNVHQPWALAPLCKNSMLAAVHA